MSELGVLAILIINMVTRKTWLFVYFVIISGILRKNAIYFFKF